MLASFSVDGLRSCYRYYVSLVVFSPDLPQLDCSPAILYNCFLECLKFTFLKVTGR